MSVRPSGAPFPRELLASDVVAAAHALLGALLVRDSGGGRTSGVIVEVEAYGGPEDRASHARARSGRRRLAMEGEPGSAYVYRVYGMHHCLNVVSGPAGTASAVLIRAVRPLEGAGLLRHARHAPDSCRDERLAAGPALVAACFGADTGLTGIDLCDPGAAIRLEARRTVVDPGAVVAGPRVGIGHAGEPWASAPLRFALRGDPALSRPLRDG